MKTRRLQKSFALLAAAGLLVAACGGDDDDSGSEEPATEEPADEPADEGDEPADEPADEGDEPADEGDEPADEAGEDEAEGDVDTVIEEVTQEAVFGGELIIAIEAEANGLRPWEDNCATGCYAIRNAIFDKLFETTVDGKVEGYLAASMTPNDTLDVWVMTLRPDVTFSNGTALTAQTIVDMFPIQQAGAISTAQVAASGLTTVEATGDLEVTYTLAAPNVAFSSFLERSSLGHVFEPAAAAADLDGFGNNPIGTGPFTLESRDIDNETRVVRRDDYWRMDANGNRLPYLDAVAFRPILDEGARLDSLLSGTVNAVQSLRQGMIRDTRAASDGLTIIEAQGNQSGGGYFNALLAPLDDVRVRRGLLHMNSQDNVIEALGGTGISLPGTQMFSPDSAWYSEKAAEAYIGFDFEAGVANLTEYVNDPERSDGKAVGEKIDVELSCPPDPTLIAAMQVIEQVWSQSELVNVNLTQYDQSTHIANAFASEHQAHCWRQGSDADPALWIPGWVGPPTEEIAVESGYGPEEVATLNFHNWFEAATYEAAIAASQTSDFDERFALYEQVSTRLNEEAVFWFSGHTALMVASADNVFGLSGWTLPDGQLGIGILPDANIRVTEAFIAG